MQNVYSHLSVEIVPGTTSKNTFSHPKASPKTAQKYYWSSLIYLFILSVSFILEPSNIQAQTCTCPGTNLVQNHSFENGTTNWNWSGGNFSTGTYAAQCGTNAGHFQITNTGSNWVSQQIGTVGSNGISAGSVLTLSVYGGTHNPSYYHQVGISYFTSNWTYITGNYTEVNAQLPSMSEYTVMSTVPSNAYYVTVEKGGNGDWVKTDRWCVSLSQCDPENSSAPPYCAPQPNCPAGNNFMWSQNINSSDGSPSAVRLVCSSQLSYTIPGSYPSAFNGPVNVNVSDVVSWDGYSGRNSVTQQNERWRVVFKKNGSTVYATPYTNDVPDLQTQGYWRGSLGTTTYLPNGADQIIIEHWSVANNSNCSNGPNSVVPVSVCIGYTPVTCSNVTNGGQIGPNQSSCLATYDPTVINNITAPSGGTGTLEYMWLKSITTCSPPNGSNDNEWEVISGANSSTYDPGPLNQNTCYIRCSRRSGCTNWDGESNVVSITVSGPAVQIASPLTLVKDRVISNEVHCSSSVQRVLWMDCLLDNSPGGTSGNAKYWKIISGGNFREYCDGTAYFEMRVQNLVTSTYQMDVKVVLSGRTHTAPAGSPHVEGCTSSAAGDWYYYTNMTGTITGVNGLAGALLSIDRKMASFQVGTNASLYASPGQFGASGWMIYNVISHPTAFKLQGECGADLNFLLSGGALTASQSTACLNICTGDNTTLTANGGGGKPGYSYAWDNNLGTGQIKTISPSTTTTYKVTITDTNGCSSTSQTTIYVNPQPVLNAGQDVEICQGQSVLLTVNATNGTPPYTYTWSNPPGGTGTSKTVNPTATTTYTVTVTDSKGCSDTDEVTVTVNPNPSVTTNANAVCTGNTLIITSTPSGGTPSYTYSWTGPNGFSASTQNINRPNATAAMAGTYSLILTDSKECVATSSVAVNITPGATVNLGPDKFICEGDQIDIHSEVTGIPTCGTPGDNDCNNPIVNSGGYIANLSTAAVCGDNAGAKLWTQGGNGTSYITLDMGSTRPIGTQICVRVKLEHCSGTSSTNSDMKIRWSLSAASGFSDIVASKTFSHTSYQTYCYTLTSAARYIRVQDNGKCSFRLDYVEYTTPDTYNSSVTYLWSGPGIIGANNGASITVNQNGTYVLVVTDCNGCSASDAVNVNINNNVTANVDGAEICLGGSATLTATPVAGATYEWTEQGSNTVISTNQSITVSPTATKVYILTVRVNGCEDSDDATVIVNPNPAVSLSSANTCIGSELTINATPSGGTPGYTYSWNGPGSYNTSTQNVSRINATSNMSGQYTITVTDTKGCKATASQSVSVTECEGEICFIGTNNNTVSAKTTYQIVYNADPAQNKLRIRTTFSKNFVDNTYGENVIGWPNGHTFGNLTGSDHLQIALFDANNIKKMELKMDYLTASAAAPSGYKSLGVTGGDGSMIFGNASDVLNVVTSLDKNFNTYNYVLTTNSPETNDDYQIDPNYPNWIYEVWYEAEVKLSAFGAAGFGTANITGIHASPSKTGNNTEMVTPGDCCVLFNPEIAGANFKCNDSPSSLQLSVSEGVSFLWSTGANTQSITVNPSQNTTYTVTVTDADNCTKVLSQEVNVIDCEGEICFTGNNEVSADVKWTISYSINENENKVKIRTTFSKNFVDNTYGTNAIGWQNGHTFGNLTGSDHLIISLFDNNNVKKMEMKMDYITASTDAPSGYRSLGVLGGDGSMIFGNASDVLSVRTSLDMNFNDYGYVLTTNSPATDANYSINATYPNWIYEVWYETEVKLSAFGASGFGTVDISGIHASPSKTGNNTEEVNPGPCCEFEAYITGENQICEGETTQLTANVIGNSSLQIPATNDTYLDENNPTKNYGNCKELFLGSKSSKKRRGLLKFDVSSIPPSANIISANVFLTKKGGTNTSTSIGLYNMNSAWLENAGGCAGNSLAPNWTQKAAGSNWNTQGGDYNNSAIAITNVAANGVYNWDILSTVQSWVSGNNNNGLMIRTTNEGVNNEFKFASSEEGNAGERPYLNVVYSLPGSGIAYLWSNGQTSQTINISPSQTTTYTVTITAPGLCDEGVAHLTVDVYPGPSLNIQGNNQICRGESTTLTANSPTATQYLWSTGSTQPNITVSPQSNTTYSVTVTDVNGCTESSSILVTTYPDLDVILTGSSICSGGTLSINLTVNGGTPNFSYNWQGPNGFTSNNQNIIRNDATVNMSGAYVVTVTDSRGCSGTENTIINVYPTPTLVANSNSPVCVGNALLLTATPSGGTPSYTYQWTGPNGFTSTSQNPTRNNATADMAGTYNVTATDVNGCMASSNTVVSIIPGPVSGINGPETTCAKESVLFTASPPAGAGAVYSWTFQGGTPANASGPSASSQWNSPGTYLITLVVTKDGCLSQYTKNIVITEEVFSLAGPDKDICQGGLTTLNGQGPVGGNFTWTIVSGDPTSIDGGTSQPDLNVSPLFTTVYRLTVSKNGCVRTDDVTVFVNVSLNPIADAGDPLEICSGFTTSIGGNPTGTPPTGAPNTNLGYIWSPLTGLNSGTVANPSLTLNTPGTYTYQVIVVALVSGCTDTATVTHTINPNPSITASAPEVCAGYTLEITSSPTGGTPGYSYAWSGPGGYSANTQNISRLNSTTAMSGMYSVTVTDTKGCIGTGSVQATINPNPSITASAPEVCAGYTLEITSSPTGGTPGYTYNWSGPGGYTANTQNISRINSTTAMSGLYSVTVTDTKGCVGTGSVQATVNPNPNVLANANSPVCQGETIALTSTPSGGTPGYTFDWSGPNGYTSSMQNPSRANANNTMSGVYTVTVTDSKGCIASASTNVSLEPKPVSGIQGPATTCAREAAFFIANPPAGPGTIYTWTFEGGNPASAMGPSASSQWDIPGEYLITLVVNKNGCDTMYTKSIIITQEVFSIAGPDKEICQGGNVTLNGQGPAGANFSWSVVAGDGTSIDNGGATMNLLVSPLYTTVYRLTVSQNGCVRTDEVTVMVNVNLNPIADAGPPLQICAGTTTIIGGNPTGTPPPAAPNTPLGYIWSPATGLNSITLPNPSLTLNSPGSYTYQVIVIALTTGCTDTATVTHVVEPKAKVGDFVWEDLNGNGRQDLGEPGINGVSVTLHNAANNAVVSSASTATRNGEAGYYEFEVCKGSYYIVFGDVVNFNRTPKNAPGSTNTNDSDANTNTGRSDNFTLNAGDFNQTIDAGYYRPARLGDFVWEDLNVNGIQDLNEPGISGVVVRLLDENGVQLAFTTTNINGLYYFNNLKPGSYIVKFDTKAGYIPTTKDVLPDDGKDSDADPITGRSHLVTLVSGQEDLTIDAGYYRLARIGDFVWEDTNLNNLQDAFEPVLSNVQVTLSGTKGTDGSAVNLVTSTDVTGFYDFSNLTPGTYTVTFTRPSSIYLSVQPNAGSDNIDSDADMVTGQTGAYNLQSGEYNNTVDAGYYRCARVGDFVWIDLGTTPNIQDAGDIGINNVEVRLYQSGSNTLIETQLTRNSPVDGRAGYYLFECVPPGQYYVKVIKPNPTGTIVRYDFVQPNQGGNDMLDSDVVDFLNGTTLTFTVGYAQTILDVDIGLITVLPVHLKEIAGWWDKVKDVNELTWTTTQETNNSHFIIERSFQGNGFSEIGRVDGKGFSAQDVQYFFTDHEISKNGSYVYQVSQEDFDGKVSIVGTVEIEVGRTNARGVNFYPNPTNGWINLEISANEGDDLSYELFDATGKLVRKYDIGVVDQKGTMLATIDLTGYAQGIYYTKVKIGDQNFIQRIVKIE